MGSTCTFWKILVAPQHGEDIEIFLQSQLPFKPKKQKLDLTNILSSNDKTVLVCETAHNWLLSSVSTVTKWRKSAQKIETILYCLHFLPSLGSVIFSYLPFLVSFSRKIETTVYPSLLAPFALFLNFLRSSSCWFLSLSVMREGSSWWGIKCGEIYASSQPDHLFSPAPGANPIPPKKKFNTFLSFSHFLCIFIFIRHLFSSPFFCTSLFWGKSNSSSFRGLKRWKGDFLIRVREVGWSAWF